MQSKMDLVRAKVAECIKLAEKTYGIKLPEVSVRFDIRGMRAAGYAGCNFARTNFYLRFNPNHMALGGETWERIVRDTVPHEVAHFVCQAFPQFGKNHNAGWKKVCADLGGNSKRCYSKEDAPEAYAAQRPYTYTTNLGKLVAVTKAIHRKVQFQRAIYTYKGLGTINCNSAVTATKFVPVSPKVESAKENKTFTRVAKVGTETNTSKMRAFIATGVSATACVEFGITKLGQTKALAVSYVKTQWVKAGRKDIISL